MKLVAFSFVLKLTSILKTKKRLDPLNIPDTSIPDLKIEKLLINVNTGFATSQNLGPFF